MGFPLRGACTIARRVLVSAALALAPAAAHAQQDARGAGGGKDTYELSAVEEIPRILNASEFMQAMVAEYPPLLRVLGVGGRVNVRFRVLHTGRVDSLSIRVHQSTNARFDEPAKRAVNVLRFRPAYVNGRPVRAWVELPIVFEVGAPADSAAATPARPRS